MSRRYIPFLLFCCLVLLLPFFLRGAYHIHILILTMMNVILTASLRLILLSGQMSLAHGGMLTVGAYTSALLVLKASFPFWLAFIMAGLFAFFLAWLVGYPFMRIRGIYFSIVTIFFSEMTVLLAQQWEGLTGGSGGIYNIPRPDSVHLFGVKVLDFSSRTGFYYLLALIMLATLLVLHLLEDSRFGLTLKAIRQADILCESFGVDTTLYRVLSFAIGSFFAGIMGSFYSHYVTAITPEAFGFLFTVYILIYMIVGGEKSPLGPIVGAAFLTLLPELLRPLKSFTPFVYAGILLAIVYFLPEGLSGLILKWTERLGRGHA
jgi:branched-chain amino acid transport system permease protein